ncbi:MAG: M16 family metallopeptidase [Sphingobacteriia bacterium]
MRRFLLACTMLLGTVFAQSGVLPLDPSVRTGVLPNGLTYYVKQNKKPEARAELRLALKAGSLQELDGQNGLAHFTEHMCFNGTEHFEKQVLVDYLEGIGTEFGPHLNAYTSYECTVYMLRIPTDEHEIVDNGLLILSDWAQRLRLETEEINKERGVVIEEWRTRRGFGDRLGDSVLATFLEGSRYLDRKVIGKTEVLSGFDPDTLRHFYHTWYRPELMAVIAVGDFDPDEMAAKIRKEFSVLSPKSGPQYQDYSVPAWDSPRVLSMKDAESPVSMAQLYFFRPKTVTRTLDDYRAGILRHIVGAALTERLQVLGLQPGAPFSEAGAGFSNFLGPLRTLVATATVTQDAGREALEQLVREAERMRRHGLLPGELERAKAELKGFVDKRYAERNSTESDDFAEELIEYFLKGEAMVGIEQESQYLTQLMSGITLSEANAFAASALLPQQDAVVFLVPDKPGVDLPTDQELVDLLARVRAEQIEPLLEEDNTAPLISQLAQPGAIVSERVYKATGITELKLSNGARVLLKPTDFKQDEIMITAYADGGISVFPDDTYLNAYFSDNLVGQMGLGSFDRIALEKKLAGKQVSISPYVAEYEHGLSGSSTQKDLETAFQLVYLTQLSPRVDEVAYQNWKLQEQQQLADADRNPESYFRRQSQPVLYAGHVRKQAIQAADLERLSLATIHEQYRRLFSHAAGFTYVFTGSFRPADLKPLITTYLAAIPQGEPQKWVDRKVRTIPGPLEKTFRKGRDPKSYVQLRFLGQEPFTYANMLSLDATCEVLSIKLRENIREEKGGVYGVGCSGGLQKWPVASYSTTISFYCDPARVEELIAACTEEIENLQKNGPTATDLNKVTETYRRGLETSLKENAWWHRKQKTFGQYAWDFETIDRQLPDELKKLNAKRIQKAAATYFDTKRMVQLVLKPEPAE